jgi:uncharacterized protein (DUF1810 family)
MRNPDQKSAGRRKTGIQPDPFHLGRFVQAQDRIYEQVLAELRRGRKETHWLWFIFPQIAGLGHSSTARTYAIKSLPEARLYLEHPLLGKRLVECAQILLQLEARSASEIFGFPDDLKLCSCMTLFAQVTGPGSIFTQVLEKFFHGKPDAMTLDLLERM